MTVIEVLSPANKTPGARGRELSIEKQRELLHGTTHLMEIDLLHSREHTVFVSRSALESYRGWDYVVCLQKGAGVRAVRGLAGRVAGAFARVVVPLLEGDPDVTLDLQAVWVLVYRQGR